MTLQCWLVSVSDPYSSSIGTWREEHDDGVSHPNPCNSHVIAGATVNLHSLEIVSGWSNDTKCYWPYIFTDAISSLSLSNCSFNITSSAAKSAYFVQLR